MIQFLERFGTASVSALGLHTRRYALEWLLALTILGSALLSMYLLIAPPSPYPSGAVVVVKEGASAAVVARELADAGVVLHPELLRALLRATGDTTIRAGAYRFAAPENLVSVARRLSAGVYGIPAKRITFPEGLTTLDMAHKVAAAFPSLSVSDFISEAGPYEGYLFPDTYTFQPSATAASIVIKLQDTFLEKTESLASDIAVSGRTLSDIVIMASIIEREARRPDDRRMISGILWNRIEKGMPLQVDAVFGYIYSRQTYSPSYADLGVDSPYNTYTNKGLPPGPICNPGLSAIDAALHPTKTKYLFYLTGRDGLMRYATTYKGHKANLNAYLR